MFILVGQMSRSTTMAVTDISSIAKLNLSWPGTEGQTGSRNKYRPYATGSLKHNNSRCHLRAHHGCPALFWYFISPKPLISHALWKANRIIFPIYKGAGAPSLQQLQAWEPESSSRPGCPHLTNWTSFSEQQVSLDCPL